MVDKVDTGYAVYYFQIWNGLEIGEYVAIFALTDMKEVATSRRCPGRVSEADTHPFRNAAANLGGKAIPSQLSILRQHDKRRVRESQGFLSHRGPHTFYLYQRTETDALRMIAISRVDTKGCRNLQANTNHTPTPNKSEPRDLATTLSRTDVVLNWTKGENENFATQVVRRKTYEGGPTITEFSVTLDAETYTDATTVSGTTYIYRIANVKNNNEDVISN